jgi:hypothetical protein
VPTGSLRPAPGGACAARALRCAALRCVRLVAPRRGGRRQHGSKPALQPGLLTRGARCQAEAELFDRATLVRMELENRSKSGLEPVAKDAKDHEAPQAMEAEEASAVAPVLARCTRARSARLPAKRSLAPRCAAPKTAAGKRASLRCAAAAVAADADAVAAVTPAAATKKRSKAVSVQRGAACRAAAGDDWATGAANLWFDEEVVELQFAADDNWRYTKSQSGIQWAKIKRLFAQGHYPLLARHLRTNNADNRCLGKAFNDLALLDLVFCPSRLR